ncbi:MAG: hypothetical protein HMLKMBBP_03710 [Planctomycetes bacterium]|nr:hypothetical protein [Planctomycetota bacterium]
MRWLEQIPQVGPARARAMFAVHEAFCDLTPTQYAASYGWLQEVGLVDAVGRSRVAHGDPSALAAEVFRAAVCGGRPLWLRDADVLIRSPDELPEDADTAAGALGLDTESAFAIVRAAWGRVDAAERARIGAAGEAALTHLLREYVNAEVQRVSLQSDGYGYDIAVRSNDVNVHIELKSTTRTQQSRFYLSRNEYETMQRDPAWQLVLARLTEDMQIAAVAVVDRTWLKAVAPADRDSRGRWESARAECPRDALTNGVPALLPLLREPKSPLLGGQCPWPV